MISRQGSNNKKKVGKRPASPDGVRLRLAGLCARSEQCEYDLRQKIRRSGLPKEDEYSIIGFLKENGYLDEHRFARAYCADKVRFSGWGIGKIRLGLIAKRLPAEIIREAIDGIDREEYIAALKRVGIAKARTLDLRKGEDSARFYRYLVARGFESALIARLRDAILRKLGD